MKFRAVIFDLDGTLLDTIKDLCDSMNAILARLNLPQHSLDEYKIFVGDGVRSLAMRALPEGRRDEATLDHCVAEMRIEYGKRWKDATKPYPGVPELLAALAEKQVVCAVLSNKPDHFTQIIVRELLPEWTFADVSGARPDVPHKPDPAGALDMAKRLGVPVGEILYLGDTNTDMKTAVAAGMYPVGALWGFRDADELTSSGAARLVAHPLEVLDLL